MPAKHHLCVFRRRKRLAALHAPAKIQGGLFVSAGTPAHLGFGSWAFLNAMVWHTRRAVYAARAFHLPTDFSPRMVRMRSRRSLCVWSLAIPGILLAGGAAKPPAPAPVAHVGGGGVTSQGSLTAPKSNPKDPTDAAARGADLLAQQAAAYARNLEPLLTTRPAPSIATLEPTTRAAEPAPKTQPAELEIAPNQPIAVVGPPTPPDLAATKVPQLTVRTEAGSRPREMTTDDLLHRFEQRAKDFPNDVAGQFDLQLFQFLREEKVPQLPEMSALPTEDREILAALLDSLTNFRNGLRRDNNMLMSNKIQPLIELATRLRSKAELTIPTIALCKAVRGFGVYDPVQPEFVAGKDQPLIVY